MKLPAIKPATIALVLSAGGNVLATRTNCPPLLVFLWSWTLNWVIADWILSDARRIRYQLWYDADTFFTAAWPVLAPIYLFKTRGTRAFIPIVCFLTIWFGIVALSAFL
jgi:hypothetical protein